MAYIPKVCLICSKNFSVKKYRENRAKFCSPVCAKISLRGKETSVYTCKHCSKIFEDSPSRNRIYCSKKCVNKEKKEIFKPKFTTVRKMMVRRGLLDKCTICGYNEFPDILGVHHIDGNRKNNDLANLKVVCPMCHSLIHRKHISH